MKKLTFLFYMQLPLFVAGQTANNTEGCVPLTVNFSGPVLSDHYWDFKDGGSSVLQNPEYVFTETGIWVVELFQGLGGEKVGEITITIYEDPIIEISSDLEQGCTPQLVNFTSNITADPGINITSYLWAFGDGGESTSANPAYTYINPGTFDVSLEITTNIGECNITERFEDFIVIEGAFPEFDLDKIFECEFPATFNITNTTPLTVGNSYSWDFGNGETSNTYTAGDVVYNDPGPQTIVLTVTTPEGCVSTEERTILVGNPQFELSVPDTICLGVPTPLANNTVADSCRWFLTGAALIESSADPLIFPRYFEEGFKEISIICYAPNNCISDTTFNIYVDKPEAEFNFTPEVNCDNDVTINATAVDDNFAAYYWSFDEESTGTEASFEILCPVRDSFWEEELIPVPMQLIVETQQGCRDTTTQVFAQWKPTARILPDVNSGCAPLEVVFTELIDSPTAIEFREWYFGDGSAPQTTNFDSIVHVFEEPGEYYVQFAIENASECKDTSNGVWIHVGEQIDPQYELDKTEICLGDTVTVTFTNDDPRIDYWHFESDDSRFDHCYKENSASHAFITEPGVFGSTATVVYNGCFSFGFETNAITVNGPKANISYMINCDSPNDVMITNESLNATSYEWLMDTIPIDGGEMFTETIEEAGVYTYYLTAFNDSDGCPESVDSVEVHITNLEAQLDMPDELCFNVLYTLDASESTGVYTDCHEGYRWFVPGARPRENSLDTIEHVFPPGEWEVLLEVKDINGCTDIITQDITVYELNADFDLGSEVVCAPSEIAITDASTADTTIVSWEWSFGSTDQNPILDFQSTTEDTLFIDLTIVDELGCMISTQQAFEVYEPQSLLVIDNGPSICQGETINFLATQFGGGGSFLTYEWNLGELGTTNEEAFPIVFDEPGLYPIFLTFTEDDSGCSGMRSININVVPTPEASFTAEVEGEPFNFDEELCHPAIIEFTNTSFTSGPIDYIWDFGNDQPVVVESPSFSFDRGTHDIEFVVASPFGCSDTISTQVTLIGPDGTLIAEDTQVCLGQSLDFSVTDLVDVNNITWNLGDGVVDSEVESVTITFNELSADSTTVVDLILSSVETGCEYIESVPIEVIDVMADFEQVEVPQPCALNVNFENLSTGADVYSWQFGNGASSEEFDGAVQYAEPGSYTVTLAVEDEDGICSDTETREILIEDIIKDLEMPNVFSPNNDDRNDFFNISIPEEFQEFTSVTVFKIYNRWGQVVYDNTSQANGWNGFFKGKPAPSEVYAYYIEVEFEGCGTSSKKGNVTIIR